jgi:hypothetical protein
MTNKLRFRDLQNRQIVDSWAQLRNLIEKYGFPPGHMLGPNTRAWDEEDEIEPWLQSRPTAGPEPRGAAKAALEAAAANKARAETVAIPAPRSVSSRRKSALSV